VGIVFIVALVILAGALEVFVVVVVVILNRGRNDGRSPVVRSRLSEQGAWSMQAEGTAANEWRHDQNRGGRPDRRQTGQG